MTAEPRPLLEGPEVGVSVAGGGEKPPPVALVPSPEDLSLGFAGTLDTKGEGMLLGGSGMAELELGGPQMVSSIDGASIPAEFALAVGWALRRGCGAGNPVNLDDEGLELSFEGLGALCRGGDFDNVVGEVGGVV